MSAFASSTVPQIRKLQRLTQVPKGTVLFRAGEPATSFFIIEAGLVRLTRPFVAGTAVVSVYGSGVVIGERALVAQGPRMVTAETLCDCTLTEIRLADFVEAATKLPDLWAWLARQLLQRSADLERRIHAMTHLRVEQRIASVLLELADQIGAGLEGARLPLTQLDVAMLVGATRETTSTTLNQMERRGLLKLGRAMIELARRDVLRAVLRGEAGASGRARRVE